MRRIYTWLFIAAFLMGPATAWAQSTKNPLSRDGYTSFVGDLPTGPNASSQPVKRAGVSTYIGDLPDASAPSQQSQPSRQPIKPVSCNQPVRSSRAASTSCDSACDATYDCGCDSMSYGGGGSCLAGLLGKGGHSQGCNQSWGRIEALLWWAEDRDSPELIVTSPDFLGLNQPTRTVVAGGDGGIESGMLAGNRVDFGRYLDSDQSYGLGSRIYGTWTGAQTTSRGGSGTGEFVGIPIYGSQFHI